MKYLLTFLILFIAFLITDYLLLRLRINTKKKKKNIMELTYLCNKFKLDPKTLNLNILIIIFAFINSLIISIISTFIIYLNIPKILKLLISFVLLLGLIYSLYEFLGRYLVKKGRN